MILEKYVPTNLCSAFWFQNFGSTEEFGGVALHGTELWNFNREN